MSGTGVAADPFGLAVGPLTDWLVQRGLAVAPLDVEPLPGGRSNLSYAICDARGARMVLRRPPAGVLLASAHDVAREHRLLVALHSTAVPVPRPIAHCGDPSVIGAELMLMEHVDGLTISTRADAERLEPAARAAAGRARVDALAAIHGVDLEAAGLVELSKHGGYLERQLRRWRRQVEAAGAERPSVVRVGEALQASMPEHSALTLVHGDYRIDNTLIGTDGAVRAVLDWELAALGDPLSDLGTLLAYWNEPDDALAPLGHAPTAAAGFPSRAELAERYAAATGRDLGRLAWYLAFGRWKLACVLHGVHQRAVDGGYGGGMDVAALPASIEHLAALAEAGLRAA